MNLILSILALSVLLLPIALIAIFIILKERESPIYLSSRVGKDQSIFLMPKFRTMRSDTPQQATHLMLNPDEYLLPSGNFLRKYSLDELPQIFSVFIGSMNFVGPRPALFNQYDLIEMRESKGIFDLKPGITGWAQVNGRDELSIKEKVLFDQEYLKRASFNFDIYIIWLTILKVVKRDGISH